MLDMMGFIVRSCSGESRSFWLLQLFFGFACLLARRKIIEGAGPGVGAKLWIYLFSLLLLIPYTGVYSSNHITTTMRITQ